MKKDKIVGIIGNKLDGKLIAKQVKEACDLAVVGRSYASMIDDYVLDGTAKFQLQYIDYEENQWTIPVLLTAERAYRFKNDKSVSNVRIIWRAVKFEIKPE